MAQNRSLICHRAISDHIINSLSYLRDQGEFCRAELYWNVQRCARDRRRSAAMHNFWSRRRALRLHSDQPHDEMFPYNLPPNAA